MSFSFGAQPTKPAASSSTGFSFGSQPVAVVGPQVKTSSTGAGLFGTPASSGGGLFGSATPVSSSGGGLFGSATPASSSGGVLFGSSTPASSTGGGLFGAQSTAGTGTLFGNTTTSSAGSSLFGNPAASTAGTSLFGTQKTTAPASGFSFSATPAASSSSGLFGNTPTASSGGLFGATSASGGLFGSSSTSGGGGGLFGTASTASTGTGLFGTSTAGGGLFGAKPASSLFTSTAQPTSAAPVTFKGLGGTDAVAGSSGATGSSALDPKLSKETAVPNELIAQIEAFKSHVAEEKKFRDEISKQSFSKPLFAIHNDIVTLRNQTILVHNLIQRCVNYAATVKEEFAAELRTVDMVNRMKDTPVSLQDASYSPVAFFLQRVALFADQMSGISLQLQAVERYLVQRDNFITAEDFSVGLRRINEAFVALVARYQQVQEKVSQLKADFLQFRKLTHGDSTDVFAAASRQRSSAVCGGDASVFSNRALIQYEEKAACTVGPSPFSVTSTESTVGPGTPHAKLGSGLGSMGTPASQPPSVSFGGLQNAAGASQGSPSARPGTKRNKSK